MCIAVDIIEKHDYATCIEDFEIRWAARALIHCAEEADLAALTHSLPHNKEAVTALFSTFVRQASHAVMSMEPKESNVGNR